MKKILITLSLIGSTQVFGETHRGMILEELSTTLTKYNCGLCSYRNPYNPDVDYVFGASQTTKVDLYRYTGNDKQFSLDFDAIFFLDSEAVVRYAGLKYDLGMTYMGKDWGVSMYWHHMSAHDMDRVSSATYQDKPLRFPVQDSANLKIIWRHE